ncbi:TIGR03619 family F420-dependent LLM class oxidoreductase [Mycolicibacterium gilvum]|uniref:Flavin-dependent oxidoreductase, F420-dependent methylene-tetrahydromethanopterin reductase n=2 Tax=Mycolicibacterium gilvum TaxID=1804 RepID=E6TNA7_MYCSR|nr:TIGR03619 family F420-dependent LLM class oxidoreductase [Mycolicibacterium gilvum]ADU00534.1 flavin-dependent oxidoreductase, F420-dependent methylene-tetrahydromethanopterin reductase [Mycolicibacterium gilvum Spyr1]MCV7055104.1 TIGR03619 family F420-dependent LLM class oxidoreductase [Mycolicibacterium gilvum]STZ42418.1 luciferase family protein [Mycolicibacterium gilvum]
MRIGLSTPVVVQTPAAASPWEAGAGICDIARIAETADDLGFDYLTCSEHVAVPVGDAAVRGATYWDPLATLGFLAARTARIRLATSVLVLGYHHPLEIAKRYGTLDRVSGGRLILGVGVGSLQPEFDLLGAPWEERGARADDAIRALRSSLSVAEPSYDGDFYTFGGMVVEPHAEQPRVPIWVGGRSRRSLRRAVGLADGWMPFGLRTMQIADMLATVDIPDGFDIVLPAGPLDPREPSGCLTRLRALRDVGATAVTCSVAADSTDHYCAQLASLRGIVDEL